IFGGVFDLGVIGYVLAAVMLVWLLNLYNFMDGIDGIASVEAITVCVGGALLYALVGIPMMAAAPLLLAAAVAGFLVWNFPPRSEEHTSELQSRENLVCRLLLEKKKDNGLPILSL